MRPYEDALGVLGIRNVHVWGLGDRGAMVDVDWLAVPLDCR